MYLPGEKAAYLMFQFVRALFTEKQYQDALCFLDNVSHEEERQYKQSIENDLKILLNQIAATKDDIAVRQLVTKQSTIIKAYLVCWFGEMSEGFIDLDRVDIPPPYTAQHLLDHLLVSVDPFWR